MTVEDLKELHRFVLKSARCLILWAHFITISSLCRARMLQQAVGNGKLPPFRGQKPLGGYDPQVAMDMMRNKRVTPDSSPIDIQKRMEEVRFWPVSAV